ncbi:MAG: hypothetical protein ACKO4Y_01515 [Flavobacteriales bacterium]
MTQLNNFMNRLLVVFGLLLFYQCNVGSSDVNRQEPPDSSIIPQKRDTLVSKVPKASWRNPVMSPKGKDIAQIIRAYYLVGDFDKMQQFMIIPPGYSKTQISRVLRNSTWGYTIKLTNIKWLENNSFILTYKTEKHNTIGMEQYIGRIVNDTAKLNLFPENAELFPFHGK